MDSYSRRELFRRAGGAAALGVLGQGERLLANQEGSSPPEFPFTVISGTPAERGRLYGETFKDGIRAFLEKEIFEAFTQKAPTRDQVLRYAGQCSKVIDAYSPTILGEMEGMAKGAGLSLEEIVLITLHAELSHRGLIPPAKHCTAFAAGPPDTKDGNTYVGQTWDWFARLYGHSSILHWKRSEGPSLLAYAYPGLWVGAGMNSAGLSACWTGVYQNLRGVGLAVGIPSYVLMAHLLYQETLKAASDEMRRATRAGWFTIVLADAQGNLANFEGSPSDLALEFATGALARHDYGTRQMLGCPEDKPVSHTPQCQRMYDLLRASRGTLDLPILQKVLGDGKIGMLPEANPNLYTVDCMVFNNTAREAHLCRGPASRGRWKTLRFDEGK